MDTKSTLLTQYLTLLRLKLNCKLCSYKTAGSTVACKFSSSFLLFFFCLEATLFIKIYLVFVFHMLPVNQWFHPLFIPSAILFLFFFKLCMLASCITQPLLKKRFLLLQIGDFSLDLGSLHGSWYTHSIKLLIWWYCIDLWTQCHNIYWVIVTTRV